MQLAQTRGIGDRLDLDDLSAYDCEIEDEEQPALPGDDESYRSIHESRPRSVGPSRELPGHGSGTTDLPRHARTRRHSDAVGSEHDVRVEHSEQCVEGTLARGGKEGIHHFSLGGEIDILHRVSVSLPWQPG